MTTSQLVHLVVGVVALLAITYGALIWGRVPLRWRPLTAILRGSAQLAVVGLALRGALTYPPAVAVVLVVMLSIATMTAGGRLKELPGAYRAAVVAGSAGSVIALGAVFAIGVLPFGARYLVALGGIVIGNTMTGVTLAGRHLLAGMRARYDEIEAWLSVGATNREAVRDIARAAAGEALIPAMDQTRTTGVVTLPGAFIGALLGGSSPTQAARFQIVVLAAILACQSIVAVLITYLLGAPRQIPR